MEEKNPERESRGTRLAGGIYRRFTKKTTPRGVSTYGSGFPSSMNPEKMMKLQILPTLAIFVFATRMLHADPAPPPATEKPAPAAEPANPAGPPKPADVPPPKP